MRKNEKPKPNWIRVKLKKFQSLFRVTIVIVIILSDSKRALQVFFIEILQIVQFIITFINFNKDLKTSAETGDTSTLENRRIIYKRIKGTELISTYELP